MTGVRPNVAGLSAVFRALSLLTIGLVVGAAVGAAQWVVLKRTMPSVKHWIPATAIGLAWPSARAP